MPTRDHELTTPTVRCGCTKPSPRRGARRESSCPGSVRRQPAHRGRDPPRRGRGLPRGRARLLPSLRTGRGRRVRQVRAGDGVLPGARQRRRRSSPTSTPRSPTSAPRASPTTGSASSASASAGGSRSSSRCGARSARRSASTAAASSPAASRSSRRSSASVASLQTPWLGLFGDQDGSIPVDDVEQLRAALARRAGRHRHRALRRRRARLPLRSARPTTGADDAADAWRRALDWFVAPPRARS